MFKFQIMLILSKSQAKNYFKKLKPYSYDEGCGCCYQCIHYSIKDNRILRSSEGKYQGNSYYNVTIVAKIKKDRSN